MVNILSFFKRRSGKIINLNPLKELKELKELKKLKQLKENELKRIGNKTLKNKLQKELQNKLQKELEIITFKYYGLKQDKTKFINFCKKHKQFSLTPECKSLIYKPSNFFTEYYNSLTGLYYTDYNNEKYREQFTVFYFNIMDIIADYYKNVIKMFDKNMDDNIIVARLIKKFLNTTRKEYCIVYRNKIDVYNYMHTNSLVKIEDLKNFENEINICLDSGRKLISGIIHLEDQLVKDDPLHANTFIISLEQSKIWRLEPNFLIEKNNEQLLKQFKLDNLKLGSYPDIKFVDYTNKAMYDFFNKNKILVNNQPLKFEGFYSSGLNENVYHGGLCVFISVLQVFLNRNITVLDTRKYLINFFEWMFYKIFRKKYNILDNHQQKVMLLIKFVKDFYSTKKTMYKTDNQNYKKIVSLNFKKLSIKNLKIEDYKNKLVFVKPSSETIKEITV
jgi:hypothetical protein